VSNYCTEYRRNQYRHLDSLKDLKNIKTGFKTNILIRENRQICIRKENILHLKIKIIKIVDVSIKQDGCCCYNAASVEGFQHQDLKCPFNIHGDERFGLMDENDFPITFQFHGVLSGKA
jgi:hypothetical protein